MLIPHSPESWISLRTIPCIDVRAPAEFSRGHIPEARSIPLFGDEARALVGTLYKHSGKEAAVRLGFELIAPHINSLIEQYHVIAPEKEVRIYCARGGMRSGSIAQMLNLLGFRVHLLQGGYKAYRQFVATVFSKKYLFRTISGKTGSGKTHILHALEKRGEQIVDLEKLASHKGSVFGALGETKQPPQQIFENQLGERLLELDTARHIWIEDESAKIGLCTIPHTLYEQMRAAPVIEIRVEKERRIEILREEYGRFDHDALISCAQKLEKHIGSERSAKVIAAIACQDYRGLDILIEYYDRRYEQGLYREPRTIIPHDGTGKSFDLIAQELTNIA